MAASNHKPRVVLQFNDFDFRHRKVLEILRARPRNMTELVVNAILHYVSCPDADREFSREYIKKIVQEVISEMQADGSLGNVCGSAPPPVSEDGDDLGDLMAVFR